MGIDFLVTAFIVTVSPGTGVVYTLATGITRGFKTSVVAAFGCTLGIVPHITAAIVGVAALLQTSAVAFQAFKVAGVVYLFFLAWQVIREKGTLKVEAQDESESTKSHFRVIITAILINFLNPKLSIFFLAFLPQFVDPASSNSLWTMMRLSLVFMLMTFVVFVVYGLFAAKVRDYVISRPRVLAWMRRSFAAAFVALGVKLALTSQ